jgi:hypothetical protein
VFPETREQRCWGHQAAKVLNALPKSVQAGARRALNEIIGAEDRAHAERAIGALVVDPGAKSRAVGLGALPRSLPLEGPHVAPQWWRPRPSLPGRHRGLVAGRLGCQPATSWR